MYSRDWETKEQARRRQTRDISSLPQGEAGVVKHSKARLRPGRKAAYQGDGDVMQVDMVLWCFCWLMEGHAKHFQDFEFYISFDELFCLFPRHCSSRRKVRGKLWFWETSSAVPWLDKPLTCFFCQRRLI
jgi:hypothetical protein